MLLSYLTNTIYIVFARFQTPIIIASILTTTLRDKYFYSHFSTGRLNNWPESHTVKVAEPEIQIRIKIQWAWL